MIKYLTCIFIFLTISLTINASDNDDDLPKFSGSVQSIDEGPQEFHEKIPDKKDSLDSEQESTNQDLTDPYLIAILVVMLIVVIISMLLVIKGTRILLDYIFRKR